jgi:hypothetical protein
MSEILPVTAIFEEPIFSTIEAAVAAATTNTERAQIAEDVTIKVKGCLIDSACWSDDSLGFGLSGNIDLIFSLREGKVEVGVDIRRESQNYSCDFASESSLIFPKLEGIYRWKKGQLIQSRINKRVTKVFAGTSLMFVYVERSPILLLSILRRNDTGNDILYWDDSA